MPVLPALAQHTATDRNVSHETTPMPFRRCQQLKFPLFCTNTTLTGATTHSLHRNDFFFTFDRPHVGFVYITVSYKYVEYYYTSVHIKIEVLFRNKKTTVIWKLSSYFLWSGARVMFYMLDSMYGISLV